MLSFTGDTVNLKNIERKAKIRAILEGKFPNLDSDVFEELLEITFEQNRVSYESTVNFIGYLFFGFVLTIPIVWLSVSIFESQRFQIISSIIACSSIIIALIIMIGFNIYSRIARTELYLNTIHQEICKRNET